ncbi:GL24906 [Drosophila persimilis]|nr:GL24906 [Drosophila persimilis]
MSEQKSLPRRGRSRYHHQQYQFSTNTTPRHHNSNKMNNNTTNTTATNTATSSGNSSKILSPRGVGGVGGVGGNLKSISSTFKSQDSIQCHIPTLVKSPSISTQQQKQFHKQQINSQNHNQNHNPNQTSSSLKQQQPLLITPKLHQLESVPSSSMHVNGQELVGLDGVVGSPLASVVPVTCMPPSSQFRPIPHKSIMPAHEPPHHHHHQGVAASSGTLLNPSTALLSSKFFTAPTLPK